MYNYCETVLLLYISTVFRLPEDVDCTETCGNKVIVKYWIYKIVYLLVRKEYVHQFTMHGMNNMKTINKVYLWLGFLRKIS